MGVAGSALFWLVLVRLTPKVQFSQHISRWPTDDTRSGMTYCVKMRNKGVRAIVDVETKVIFRTKGLSARTAQSPTAVRLDSTHYEVAKMTPTWPRLSLRRPHSIRLAISPETTGALTRSPFPPLVRGKAKTGTLSLDDLLSVGDSPCLDLIVSGTDGWSGRRTVSVHRYHADDVETGLFEPWGLGLVDSEQPG